MERRERLAGKSKTHGGDENLGRRRRHGPEFEQPTWSPRRPPSRRQRHSWWRRRSDEVSPETGGRRDDVHVWDWRYVFGIALIGDVHGYVQVERGARDGIRNVYEHRCVAVDSACRRRSAARIRG